MKRTCPRRRDILKASALAFAGVAVQADAARAQGATGRPITFIVPFPPGGTSDTMARLVAQEVGKSIGQVIVIENRAGANGNIGSAAAARMAPDGQTLVLSGIGSHAINPGLYSTMPYDPLKDFTHIAMFASGPNAIAVHPSFPARDLKAWVDEVRKHPDQHNYASSGPGSSSHLAMELFKQKAGLQVSHVPYRGSAPAITDVLGGQVPILITNADSILPHARESRLRVLAVTSATRSSLFPDVPSIAESGFPDVVAASWTGISAPAGLSAALTSRLNAEVQNSVNGPLKGKLQELGMVPASLSPDDYAAFVASELAKWTQVARTAGITAD
jgi:tripartite-type tricarboxylate transporter receptor subunit TctC